MPTNAQPKEWVGKEATVEIGPSIDGVTEDNTLESQMSDEIDYSGTIRDITLGDPEAGLEIEDTFGGQIKAESPPEGVTIEFTFRLDSTEVFEEQHGSASTYTTNTETWTRVSGTSQTGSRPERAILFNLTKTIGGTTYKLNYLLNNAKFSQTGDVSLDADGNAELSANAMGRVEDRYIERNF